MAAEKQSETGYLESCCWTFERQHCPGARCACRCHRPTPQAAFVAQWREQHPSQTYGPVYVCPLCGKGIQSKNAGPVPDIVIAVHEVDHGADWLAYEAAARPADDRKRAEGG